MKFGLMFANTGPFAGGPGAALLGPAAEAAGFDSLWTVEHVLYPEGYTSTYPYSPTGKMPGSADSPIPDPLVWLSFVAATTAKIELATGILILPQRNPAITAKEASTLDQLSGGRHILGIGVGWLEEEFKALDVPFAGRGARTDEYIDVMRKLWTEDLVTHAGEHVTMTDCASNPKPVNGTVPIHIGGHSKRAARRAGELGDGFLPGDGNIPELMDMARQYAADAGRDPAALEMTAGHPGLFGDDPAAAVQELASWGVHQVFVPAFLFYGAAGDLDSLTGAMSAFTSGHRG